MLMHEIESFGRAAINLGLVFMKNWRKKYFPCAIIIITNKHTEKQTDR